MYLKWPASYFQGGELLQYSQDTAAGTLTLGVVFHSAELFIWREWKLPQHRDSFKEALGRLSAAEGYWWVKDYNVRPLCSGHGGQLHHSMTALHPIANDLLGPAVSQVFAFPLRSHMGRLQIASDVHLRGLCVIDLGSLVCGGQSSCEQWYKLQEIFSPNYWM